MMQTYNFTNLQSAAFIGLFGNQFKCSRNSGSLIYLFIYLFIYLLYLLLLCVIQVSEFIIF